MHGVATVGCRTMSKVAVLALFATVPLSPATAEAGQWPSNLQGVWQGTLGAQPIRACFNEDVPYGLYFYQSHLSDIPLQQPDGNEAQFVEGDGDAHVKAPQWTLASAGPDSLAGKWTSGSRTLPITLKRVPVKASEDMGPCGSLEYQAPRLDGIRTLTKPAVKDGLHYTRLILDPRGRFGGDISVETFAIDGDSPAVRQINDRLGEALDTSRDDSWFECVRMADASSPNGASHNKSYQPHMVSTRWLSVGHHWDGYCGGAHPDAFNSAILFDRETGGEVDLLSWFNGRAVKREQVDKDVLTTVLPPLRHLILSGWKARDQDCGEAVRSEDYWHAELTRSGFVFTPDLPHVVAACGDEFRVSFARAAPFLTDEGKKNVAALQAETTANR